MLRNCDIREFRRRAFLIFWRKHKSNERRRTRSRAGGVFKIII
jgi:hypothetical protein